jgi:hypothetical protein
MDVFNDFQRIIRSDDLVDVIDKFHIHKGRECVDIATKIAMRDFLSVLDSLKNCNRSSFPWVVKLAKILSTLTPSQCALFLHVIGGGELIQFAISEGITEQAAHQMWWRVVGKNPELKDIKRRRKNHGDANTRGDVSRQPLEGDMGEGSHSS